LTLGAASRRIGNHPHTHSKKGQVMRSLKQFAVRLVTDEAGGEVLEYALIAGLIVVAAIAVITSVGGKVLARWTSLNSSL